MPTEHSVTLDRPISDDFAQAYSLTELDRDTSYSYRELFIAGEPTGWGCGRVRGSMSWFVIVTNYEIRVSNLPSAFAVVFYHYTRANPDAAPWL